MDAIFLGHGVYMPPRAGGTHQAHCLHVNVVPLCVAACLLRPHQVDEFGLGQVVVFVGVLMLELLEMREVHSVDVIELLLRQRVK